MAVLHVLWLPRVPSVRKIGKKKKKEDCKLTDFFITCCHCIIKTSLLRLLDLAKKKWKKNRHYKWKWIIAERQEIRLWKLFTFQWSAESPCRWKRLEMYPITPVCSCHSSRGTLTCPKSTFGTLTCLNIFSIRIFLFLTTSIAFEYICLVGLMCSTLYMLTIPVNHESDHIAKYWRVSVELKQCRSCCKNVLEWDWKCDACRMCVLVIEVLIAGVSEASCFPFRHL